MVKNLQKSEISGIFVLILAGLSFGTIPIFSATLRDLGVSSLEQTFYRILIGAIGGIVIIFSTLKIHEKERISLSSFELQKSFFLQGFLLAIMIIVYLSSVALKTPVGQASFLIQIHPLVTFVLGYFFLNERITKVKLLSLLFAFTGLIILTRPWEWTTSIENVPGELLAMSNGFLYAIYLMIGRYYTDDRRCLSPLTSLSWVLCWTFICGIPLILIFSFLPVTSSIVGFNISVLLRLEVIFISIIFGIICSIVPYGLIMKGTQTIESSKASIILLVEPVGAVVLGAIFLQETITEWYIIGGFWLLLAIYILTYKEKKS